MNALHQTSLAIALGGFLLAPATLQAREISQPASILPWSAAPSHSYDTIAEPVATNNDTPAWLINTSAKPIQLHAVRQELPGVETETYTDLGQIRAFSAPLRSPVSQNGSSTKKAERPTGLLRGLGIRATRPSQRR